MFISSRPVSAVLAALLTAATFVVIGTHVDLRLIRLAIAAIV